MDEANGQLERRNGFRRAIWLLAGGLVLAGGFYLFVTSGFFFRHFMVPRWERLLGAEFMVEDLRISLTGGIRLIGFKVVWEDGKHHIAGKSLVVEAGLFDLWRGHGKIRNLEIHHPVVQWASSEDGFSWRRVHALAQAMGSFSIGRILMEDGVLRFEEAGEDNDMRRVFGIDHGSAEVVFPAGSARGRAAWEADWFLEAHAQASNGHASRRCGGKWDHEVEWEWPESASSPTLQGTGAISITTGTGGWELLAPFRLTTSLQLVSDRLESAEFQFRRGDQSAGTILCRGPFALRRREGRIAYTIDSLDRHVLNLPAALWGYDAGNASISGSGVADLSRQGRFLVLQGDIQGTDLTLRRNDRKVTPCELRAAALLNVDFQVHTLLVRQLNATIRQAGGEVLSVDLARPMHLAFGKERGGFKDSVLTLTLNHLDFAQWQPVANNFAESGVLTGRLDLQSRNDGRALQVIGDLKGSEMALRLGAGTFANTAGRAGFHARIVDFDRLDVEDYELKMERNGESWFQAEGSLEYRRRERYFSVRFTADSGVPTLLTLYPNPPITARQGLLSTSIRYTRRKDNHHELAGSLGVRQFDGVWRRNRLENINANCDFRVLGQDGALEIQKAFLTLRQEHRTTGIFHLNGTLQPRKHMGNATFQWAEVDRNTLLPLLNSLGWVDLFAAADLAGECTVTRTPEGLIEWHLKSSFQPLQINGAPPIQATLTANGHQKERRIHIANARLNFPPSSGITTNQLRFQGDWQWGKTTAASTNNLHVRATSLDLNPIYESARAGLEWWHRTHTNSSAPPAYAADPPISSPLGTEWPNMRLDLAMDRAMLNQLEMTNCQAELRWRHGQIVHALLDLHCNGAPLKIEATVVGPPSSREGSIGVATTDLPLGELRAALAESPAEWQSGNFTLQGGLKWRSHPGRPLLSSLNGAWDIKLENASIPPEHSPFDTILSSAAELLQIPEIRMSPVEGGECRVEIDSGRIALESLRLRTTAFQLEGRGTIDLAKKLPESSVYGPVSLRLQPARPQPPDSAGQNAAIPPQPTTHPFELKGTLAAPRLESGTSADLESSQNQSFNHE